MKNNQKELSSKNVNVLITSVFIALIPSITFISLGNLVRLDIRWATPAIGFLGVFSGAEIIILNKFGFERQEEFHEFWLRLILFGTPFLTLIILLNKWTYGKDVSWASCFLVVLVSLIYFLIVSVMSKYIFFRKQ